jgi:hypothetical protein
LNARLPLRNALARHLRERGRLGVGPQGGAKGLGRRIQVRELRKVLDFLFHGEDKIRTRVFMSTTISLTSVILEPLRGRV